MLHFQGEDLIVMNIAEIKNSNRVVIDNTRINHFRDGLRQHGILFDLGLREFETLQFRYPWKIRATAKIQRKFRQKGFHIGTRKNYSLQPIVSRRHPIIRTAKE